MDALRETKLVGEFKKLVLDQLHAIFGPKYTDGCTFSVTTSVSINNSDSESDSTPQTVIYTAQAIVYTVPGSFTKWELLRESSKPDSISSAMGSLLRDLQLEMERISGPMLYGDIYDGKDHVL